MLFASVFYIIPVLILKKATFSFLFRRQRATQPGNSPWEVLLDSLNSTINSLQVQVINTRTQARLQLELIALADSTLHLQLDELNPIRLRYRARESLTGSPQLSRFILIVEKSFQISLKKNFLIAQLTDS